MLLDRVILFSDRGLLFIDGDVILGELSEKQRGVEQPGSSSGS
jgi:hypothetical protein